MRRPSRNSVKLRLEIVGSQVRVVEKYGNVIIIDLDLQAKQITLNSLMILRQRNGRWYLRLWVNGRRMELATGEIDYDKALLKICDTVRRATRLAHVGPEKVPITFAELAKEYRPFAERTKSKSSLRSEVCTMKRLLEYFGVRKLTQITSYDIERFMLKRGKEVNPSTVNRSYALLSHMLNKAVDWDYIKDSPCRRVKKLKEPPGRIRWLTDTECERLLDECTRSKSLWIYEIVFTALNTGMRKGEMQSLTFDDVDFEQKLITVNKTKTNEVRYIPINNELFAILKELRDSNPHWHYVFSKEDGTAYGNWRLAFQKACQRAGIKDFRFHDLRHTFASYLAMEGYNVFTIQRLTGHKTLSMVARYTHLADRHVRDAACVLGEKLGKLGKRYSPSSEAVS